MASLTKSYQLLGQVDLGVVYGSAHAYFRLYGKYNSQNTTNVTSSVSFKETIYVAGSGTSFYAGGNVHQLTGQYTDSVSPGTQTFYAGETTVLEVTKTFQHNTSTGVGSFNIGGAHSDALFGYKSIGTVSCTLPTIAVKPTLSISSLGTIGSGNTSCTFVLGNTGGRSTKVQYSVNNSTWVNWQTKSSNGTYTANLPSLITNYPKTSSPTVYFRASNSGGTSSTVSKSTTVDSSIKPTISSVEITSTSLINELVGKYVKNITTPIITTTAAGVYGSTISTYTLNSLTGFDGSLPKAITNPFTGTKPFLASGSVKAKVTVTDTRSRTAALESSNVNVIDYEFPMISQDWSVQRCLQDGTLNEDGGYGLLTIPYKVYPINDNGQNLNNMALYYKIGESGNFIQIPTNSWDTLDDPISIVIGNGSFATNNTYDIYVKLVDIAKTVNYGKQIVPSATLESKRAGGDGITYGRVASEAGMHDYFGFHFHNGIYIGNTLILWDDSQ